jgi:hypothetical protein
VDPLTKSYPELTPYQFASNTPIQAIDLDGLEAFFVHGTNSNPGRWLQNPNTVTVLQAITTNQRINTDFSWEDLSGTLNNEKDRFKAAERLADFVIQNRVEGEDITLIGHSHGGNVAIQAAEIISQRTGLSINLITIATPVYEKATHPGTNEDPGRKRGAINYHVHIYNDIDGVQGGLAGGDRYNNNRGFTQNHKIDVSGLFNSWEWMDAHSFDVTVPFTIMRENIPQMPNTNYVVPTDEYNRVIPSK